MKSVIERWKPVRGYESLYEASDCGCVRSLKFGKVRYLKNAKGRNCYEYVGVWKDGKNKRILLHRLVYEAFNVPIPDGYEIDHINTIRDDNRLSNLRVVTRKGNMANPITRPRHLEAMKKLPQSPEWQKNHREGTRKARNKSVLQINMNTDEIIREWECARDAARELGVKFTGISNCCHGNQKTAGGFKWKFAS